MKNITITFILERTISNYNDILETGIYKIYHVDKPDILYIGSASSNKKWRSGFKQRWVNHIRNLNCKEHHSFYLQNVVNKYGINGLRFEIIEKCLSKECIVIEQKWLDYFQPFGNNGYNTCRIAGNSMGYKFPEEKKVNKKAITQYDLEGNFIKDWISLNEASRELSVCVSSVKDCCKKRISRVKNFVFRYLGDNEAPEKDKMKIPMVIRCYNNNQFICEGLFLEIKNLVPDTKYSIYNSINKSIITKKGWKYIKIK